MIRYNGVTEYRVIHLLWALGDGEYLTLSLKNEQWKWIELPEMDNIWMEDWPLRFFTWTFLKTGMPKG